MNKISYILLLFALCFSFNLNASDSLPGDDNHNVPSNWRGTYYLKDLTRVIHTPDYIQIGSQKIGSGLSHTKEFHGMKLSAEGLQLRKDSTRRQFEDALLTSGILGGYGNPPKQQNNPPKKKSMRNSDPGQIEGSSSATSASLQALSNSTPIPSGQKD